MDSLSLGSENHRMLHEDKNYMKAAVQKESEFYDMNQLRDILHHQRIRTVFQPIISLADASILGYEALSRGPAGHALEYPDALFSTAKVGGQLWELECLCRTKALENSREIFPDHMLFVNIDPGVIDDEEFGRSFTREFLMKFGILPENIVFEITEKTPVDNLKAFKQIIDHYVEQGYKIAVDDAGSGYSGLNMLAEIRPQYIKIDMKLIRDIDRDGLRQALLRALQEFCLVANIKMIAEGIETINELHTLIDLGIQYGQGYFIEKPSDSLKKISDGIRKTILDRNRVKGLTYYHNASTISIGDMAKIEQGVTPYTRGGELLDMFNTKPNVQGVAVVEKGKLFGLVMKDKFFAKLGTQYGNAIFIKRPITLMMNRDPLAVDYDTPLDKVSKLVTARREEDLYDYVVVTKDDHYYGIITVKDLLEQSTEFQINYAKHLNALTGLPGNNLIERNIMKLIERGKPFSVLYIDLDNFKSYNDVYGFENGDKLLQMAAQVLMEETTGIGTANPFIGHIGGDDFVITVENHDVGMLCENIIGSFDNRVKEFYKADDVRLGYITCKNRHGEVEKFPLVTISLAGVTNRNKRYVDVSHLAEDAGKVKKACKLVWRSCFCIE